MSELSEIWSSGTCRGKSDSIRKALQTTKRVVDGETILPKIVKPETSEMVEKDFAGDGADQPGLGAAMGLGRFIDKNSVRKVKPETENFRDSSSAVNKTEKNSVAEELLTKEQVETILKESGWDRLPMTDKARQTVEDAISRGAKPATEYTGKVMIERGFPEEPPSFHRPENLKAGDRVVALHWVPMGVMGAKFDMPYVPEAAKIKKMYVAPAKVTKDAYPPGRGPRDISKVETVAEDRLWGMDLEPETMDKDHDGADHGPCPILTKDTTMVLRLEPLATPQGEVSS